MFWHKKVICDKCGQKMFFLETKKIFSPFLNRMVKVALYARNCGHSREVVDE